MTAVELEAMGGLKVKETDEELANAATSFLL